MALPHAGRRPKMHPSSARVKTAVRDAKHHQRLQGPKPKVLPHHRKGTHPGHRGTYLNPRHGL